MNDTDNSVAATEESDAVLLMVVIIGEPGTAAGVPLTELVAEPLPMAFTART